MSSIRKIWVMSVMVVALFTGLNVGAMARDLDPRTPAYTDSVWAHRVKTMSQDHPNRMLPDTPPSQEKPSSHTGYGFGFCRDGVICNATVYGLPTWRHGLYAGAGGFVRNPLMSYSQEGSANVSAMLTMTWHGGYTYRMTPALALGVGYSVSIHQYEFIAAGAYGTLRQTFVTRTSSPQGWLELGLTKKLGVRVEYGSEQFGACVQIFG